MKTTVEIADPLLAEAKRAAAARGITVRALIEAGLRRVLDEHDRDIRFRLRDVSFEGDGLTPEFEQAGWHLRGPGRVIAVDTNILVYAHRRDAIWHERAAAVLRELAEGPRGLGGSLAVPP